MDQLFNNPIVTDAQAVVVAFLAFIGALAHFLALFPLPNNSIVTFLNKLAGNYGKTENEK